jgi:membrane fusion protein
LSLFRPVDHGHALICEGEVVSGHSGWVGAYSILLAVALLAGTVVLAVDDYARRGRVSGFLVPDLGLVKVMPPKDGRVIRRFAEEGDHVRRDDVLFAIDVGAVTSVGRTGDLIAASLTDRRNLLGKELERLDVVQRAERDRLLACLDALDVQVRAISQELGSRRNYLRLAENATSRNKVLQTQNIYSVAQLEKSEMDATQAQIQIALLERQLAATKGELAQNRAQLAGLDLKQANERSQLEREAKNIDQQMVQVEEQRIVYVRAPQDGVVTGMTLDVGGSASVGAPLLTIIPDGARLQANLYVSSAAAGFVRPGTPVLIRYDAYPYEKFGLQDAEVVSVSRTAVNPRELPFPTSGDDPLYLVTARLSKATITAFGKEESLQPGAKLEADLILERRKLWEWAIEPLLAARASL